MNTLSLPSTLKIHLSESRYEILSLLRQPGFALPTLLFPLMFYVFFGLVFDFSKSFHMPTYLIATYGAFGVIAPAMFGFGIQIATERSQGWLKLKQASPMPKSAYFVAKLCASTLFGAVVVLLLMILGAAFGDVRLTRIQWYLTFIVLVLGSIPFCAVGLLIGTLVSGNAAPAVVNLIYLPMALLSGLWVPLPAFPPLMQKLAIGLPAYHLAQLALSAVGQPIQTAPWISVIYLSAFGSICGGLAVHFFYRNES